MNVNVYAGRLATDIELKKTASGASVASFSVAVKRPHKKDATDFIRCVAWEKNAEFVSQYFKKGDGIIIDGYLTQRTYEDKNGDKRYSYEVVCERFEFGERKNESDN